MNTFDLHLHPDPLLRRQSQPVLHVGKEERRLLDAMLDTMRRWKAVGLAAPQVGRGSRVITAEFEGTSLGLANPVVIDRTGMDAMVEGCLSLPGRAIEVRRSCSVWVKAVDPENKKVELKLEGFLARIVQHEIDHLDGVLIIDYLPVMEHETADRGYPLE